MRRELIYDFMKLSLSEMDDIENFFEVKEDEWASVYRFLAVHGVAPLVCSGLENKYKGVRPPSDVLVNFIGADSTSKRSYARMRKLVYRIDEVLKESQVKCLLLKGLSLAEYYPIPGQRKFSDLDLYAPGEAEMIDEVFSSKGLKVDADFYRHSHISLDGILIENHYYVLDVRGRNDLLKLDADLKKMASEYLETLDTPGLHYPSPLFSLIFNLHHAMSHFIYEGISFKFLADWIYFLRRERELLASDVVAAYLKEHKLMKFAAVMSEVSVNYLGLDLDDVPECIRVEMASLKPDLVEKFLSDLFRPYEQSHKKTIIAERLNNVRRIVKSSWKPKAFLGQSAIGFVWDKFFPILMGKKFVAD